MAKELFEDEFVESGPVYTPTIYAHTRQEHREQAHVYLTDKHEQR